MSEKRRNFCSNFINFHGYHKCPENKTSTSLLADFIVVFANLYFAIVISNIHGRKKRFSESSKNSMFENRFLVSLRSPSQRLNFSHGGGGCFLLVHSKRSILTKR